MLSNLIRLRVQTASNKISNIVRSFSTNQPQHETFKQLIIRKPSMIFFLPAFFTGLTFMPLGAYNAYNTCNAYNIQCPGKGNMQSEVIMTVGGAIMGYCLGSTLGLFWPITLSVYAYKKYKGQPINWDLNI